MKTPRSLRVVLDGIVCQPMWPHVFGWVRVRLATEPSHRRSRCIIETSNEGKEGGKSRFRALRELLAGRLLATSGGLVGTLMGVALVLPAAAQTLTVSEVTVNEGGTATVYLNLSIPVDFAIRYTYFTHNSTARFIDEDYQKTSGFVYLENGHTFGTTEAKIKSDSETEEDETFFVDFNSLHTLGWQPGTDNWVSEQLTGFPQDISACVTIHNVVARANNPAPCTPWPSWAPSRKAFRARLTDKETRRSVWG